ncbi:IS200/IS605 family accessory protein TnpB-related protein [Methylacidimicrobium sp. B4]|uniref:IS200/IS605 family accessory protein TnpB-related protein n=1 Tax=Methylacidimicrobium sp. B4 TaxID=2796139 RepID=UPI001A8E98AA|nr:IS200/IS605 family accessory protein TnpB-related protein [Methylacidimicrobium sp. B4]QSR85012.1 IS200/IS605 family accessory protein TnpB-related protein [Methylacidimicrobium sp. B4]QSR85277.1 IS200/IS605 family accessory protein TnpB-related protein [Methylacidimicrobium sp. B4]
MRFAYGQEEILQGLAASRIVLSQTKTGKPVRKREGVAVSYRFLRDRKGWRVFASVPARPVPVATSRLAGAVGIDINHDHLAVAETERFGNLRRALRVDLNLYGKTEDQAKAIIGDAARMIVEMARERGLPLVLERLDLKKRRAELEVASPSAARKISSFGYSKTISLLKVGCFRAGVEGIEVDPAYTSMMGAMNHARRHGIGSHQGAAYAVARRGLGLSQASDRAGGRPRRPAMAATSPLPYPRGIGRSLCGRSGRRFGGGSKRRRQRMPGREACESRPRLCSRKRGHWAQPGHCRRNPGTRTVGRTVRPTSSTTFPGSGMFVYVFRNGIARTPRHTPKKQRRKRR